MPINRMEVLKQMLDENPRDDFARYGLAMEYANRGDFKTAVAEYGVLLGQNPDYAAAYFHAGQALEKLGRVGEARSMYEKGIEVTTRTGDQHTRRELQGALDLLP